MLTASSLVPSLLQAVSTADTIIAKTLPVRGVLEWTSGILQILVLLLGIGVLAAAIVLLIGIKKALDKIETSVEKLTAETRPLLASATGIANDAREVVAMVKIDVERVTDAAAAISEQLLDAAETTARRVDEVNAVIDVLQAELEHTAISTVAAVRGVRVGAAALGSPLAPSRTRTVPLDLNDDDE